MDNKRTNWLKVYIIDVLPCITLLLYSMAIVYNKALFSVFNINIINYASLKDLFISIIDVLVLFCALSLVTLLLFIHLKTFLFQDDEENVDKVYVEKKGKKTKDHAKKSNKESADKNQSWEMCKFSITVLFTSLIAAYLLFYYDILNVNLAGAALALFIPVLMICGTIELKWLSTKFKFIQFDTFKMIRRLSTIETVEITIMFLLYASFIFTYTGRKTGEFIMANETPPFEIMTSGGIDYNNTDYKIISIFNERVFLYEKATGYNVILNRGSISCIKTDNHNDLPCYGGMNPIKF